MFQLQLVVQEALLLQVADHAWLLVSASSSRLSDFEPNVGAEVCAGPTFMASVSQSSKTSSGFRSIPRRRKVQEGLTSSIQRSIACVFPPACAQQSPASKRAIDYRINYMHLLQRHTHHRYAFYPSIIFYLTLMFAIVFMRC